MHISTHESVAGRIGEHVGDRLPSASLLAGSVAPNRFPDWPRPHHLNKRVDRIVTRYVRAARRLYLEGRRDEAARQLGAAMHYALDNMVPHPDSSADHSDWEIRFARAESALERPPAAETELADGRVAHRSISHVLRLGGHWIGTDEERLTNAYEGLTRIAVAVTEAAEPVDLLRELARQCLLLQTRLHAALREYGHRLEAAYKARVRDTWRWAGERTGPHAPGPFWRRAIGKAEVARAEGRRAAPQIVLLAWLGLHVVGWRMRRALCQGLEPAFRPAALSGQFEGRAVQCLERVRAIRDRRSHWQWFRVRWSFWTGRARRLCRDAVRKLHRAQGALVNAELSRLREACAEEAADATD